MAKAKQRTENDVLTEVERRLATASLISSDVETSGLDWRVNDAVGYVLTFDKKADGSFYLPIRHKGGGNFAATKVLKIMRAAASRQTLHWVFHHAAFDLNFFSKDGIKLSGTCEDTMVNEALLDEYARSFSLDACCERRNLPVKHKSIYTKLAKTFGLGEAKPSTMSHFHMLAGDDPDAVTYAAGDGSSTLALRDYQHKQMEEQDLMTVWDIESRLIKVLHKMSWRGIAVDEERLAQVRKIIDRGIETAARALPKGLNTKSNVQLAEWFEKLGVKEYPRTPKGNPSFTQDWLQTNEHGLKIVRARKYQHMKDSFITPLIERHLYRGRVHATYNQTKRDDYGVVVGRLSCNDPNLQQAHKRDSYYGVLYRSLFVPDRRLWSANDLLQCEPVLLAHYSECKVLVEGYLAEPPIDAHSAVAKAAFGYDEENPDHKPLRQKGKTLNQAIITGAGTGGAARLLKSSEAEAKVLMDQYFEAMPEIRDFKYEAARVMRQRGYIKTLLGRRCRIQDSGDAYLAVNRILQGGNADIIKESMVRIDDYLVAEKAEDLVSMNNNVHDDLNFDHEDSPEARRHLAECHRIFTDYGPGRFRELLVPMRVDHDEGKNWAEATWGVDEVVKQFKAHGARY